MTRATFIQSLFAVGAAALMPKTWQKQYQKYYLLQCFVAGFRFHKGVKFLKLMKQNDILELKREPTNKYDSNAIAIYWKNKMIGFIPAENNEILSRLLDADALPIHAEILHIEPKAKEWENVHVGIFFLKETEHFKTLPPHAEYLTMIDEPEYYTIYNDYENITRIQDFNEPEKVIINTTHLHINDEALLQKIISKNDNISVNEPQILENKKKTNLSKSFKNLNQQFHDFASDINMQLNESIENINITSTEISNTFNVNSYKVLDDNDIEKLLPFVKDVKEIKDQYNNVFTEIILKIDV